MSTRREQISFASWSRVKVTPFLSLTWNRWTDTGIFGNYTINQHSSSATNQQNRKRKATDINDILYPSLPVPIQDMVVRTIQRKFRRYHRVYRWTQLAVHRKCYAWKVRGPLVLDGPRKKVAEDVRFGRHIVEDRCGRNVRAPLDPMHGTCGECGRISVRASAGTDVSRGASVRVGPGLGALWKLTGST
jgi:hypothetical protein